jgi:hypothetical protein
LREGPSENAVGIEVQHRSEAMKSPLDHRGRSEYVWALDRVPQRCSDLEFELTDDSLRIDGDPSAPIIE